MVISNSIIINARQHEVYNNRSGVKTRNQESRREEKRIITREGKVLSAKTIITRAGNKTNKSNKTKASEGRREGKKESDYDKKGKATKTVKLSN